MENKTYHGGIIGWILGGSFIVIGILNFVFVPAAKQNSPAWLLTAAGLILLFLFQTRVRFDSTGFSLFGPLFIPSRVDYKDITLLRFEYRDRKYPDVPTSIRYRLISGKWKSFSGGLYSAAVLRQIAKEFQDRVHPPESIPGINLINMENLLRNLRVSRRLKLTFFLIMILFCLLNVFLTWLLLLPSLLFLLFFISCLRIRPGSLTGTVRFLENFSAEADRLCHSALGKVYFPLQTAGNICGEFRQKADRFSAYYSAGHRFVVFDMLKKRFFYCRLFRTRHIEKYLQHSTAFSEIEYLAVCQIGGNPAAGIFAVAKDGSCYGLGSVSGKDLRSLDDVLVHFAETLGPIPVVFL